MAEEKSFDALFNSDPDDRFAFIAPPFFRNHSAIAQYPPEVSGHYLLRTLSRRLGWESLRGRRLFDLGCGVRFTRTIVNLDLEIGLYAGVDVHAEAIAWLKEHVRDPRFFHAQFEARNTLYNPQGRTDTEEGALAALGAPICEAACMFSVITHQAPDEAALTFRQLRHVVEHSGRLYFTSFVDPSVEAYREARPDKPGLVSTYNPDLLMSLVRGAGWRIDSIYPKTQFQQTAFVCTRLD